MKEYINIELVKAKPYENIDVDKNLDGIVRQGYTVSTDDNDNLTRFVNKRNFKRHYTSVDNMSSYHALYMLINGYKVRRKAWDKYSYIMTGIIINEIALIIYFKESGTWEFYKFTMVAEDILSNDWELYKDEIINYKGVEIEDE